MNIIDERNVRTIYRKMKKAEYDKKIHLAAKADGSGQWVRLLDEGMVVDAAGRPDFYIKKRTLRTFYESLPEDYVGTINLGHMDFAIFPIILGQWTKEDLRLVDIGDGREALDVRLRLNESLGIVQDLQKMEFSHGVSAEFSYNEDVEATKRYGFLVVDGVNIGNFAVVGDAGNVNSSGIQLKGDAMTVTELAAMLESEEQTDLAALNKKLSTLIDDEQGEAAKETAEEAPPAEEAPETPAEEVKEEAEAPKEPEKEAPEAQEKGLAAIGAVIESLQAENARLKVELEEAKASLAAKNKAEQDFIKKFKNLSVSLATERVAKDVEESTTDVVTDGIGEI